MLSGAKSDSCFHFHFGRISAKSPNYVSVTHCAIGPQERTKMITHFNKSIKTWAAADVIQTALAGTDCTRTTSTAGSTRMPGDGWVGKRDHQRASAGISAHARLFATPRVQSDGFRGGRPPSSAARQGTGPPAAADCFARWQGD
jgi:hypothetical protein